MTKKTYPSPPPVLTNRNEQGETLTRRSVLKTGASGAAALGIGALWSGNAYGSIGGPGGLTTRSDLLMLVNRVSQGFSQAEMTKATTLGYAGYLASVLAGPASDPAGDAFINSWQPTLGWTPLQATIGTGGAADEQLVATQLTTIGLSAVSEKILLERMMDFWSNRLSVYGLKAGTGALKAYSDFHIIRPNAFGSVKTLLTEFAQDTSGLWYLDNWTSSGPVPNENWAREYLELYSMGQNDPITGAPNYTEADVQAAAGAFTGWTLNLNFTQPTAGLFKYEPSMHLGGQKFFQGVPLTLGSATQIEGDEVVASVVNSPKTARGIAGKMIRHFLRKDPDASQVTTAEASYLNADAKTMVGDILAQANVSALTTDDYFLSSPSRFVYQALRAMDASPLADRFGLLNELKRMGNAPFEWPAPDGYPDEPGKWAGGIFARWEFANKLFTAPDGTGENPELDGVVFTDAELLAKVQPFVTVMDIVNNLDQLLTGGILSTNEKCVLEAYGSAAISPPFNLPGAQVLRELYALTISCPSFQYY